MTWHWAATTITGVQITESKCAYDKLDRSQIIKFGIYNEVGGSLIELDVLKGQNFFFRRRVEQNMSTGNKNTVFILGLTQHTEVIKVVALYPDRKVEIVERFDPRHKWLYPINLLPMERGN